MKIGIVTEYYYPTLGGIQEHVHHFARAVRRHGHSVRIITPTVEDDFASSEQGSDENDEADGVIRLGRSLPLISGGSLARASAGPGLGRGMRQILLREQFDVVHVHSPLMPTLPLLALRDSNAVNVGTFHSDFERSLLMRLARPILQRYLDRLDAAIGVSETALRGPRRYFDAPWRVEPNGVDCALFAGGRRRPAFDDGRLNLVHMGRFDPRNGVDRVIAAWLALRRRGVDCRLILVGDGPLRARYQAMVPRALAHDVHFEGFVASAERPSYYASADVLLCPALGGTFGIIVLEAMAAGAAVVAADTPGFRTIMQDGVQGALVAIEPPGCADRLADACQRLLGDPAARQRAGAAGRRTAQGYDWSVVAGRVLAIYEELRGGRVRRAA